MKYNIHINDFIGYWSIVWVLLLLLKYYLRSVFIEVCKICNYL